MAEKPQSKPEREYQFDETLFDSVIQDRYIKHGSRGAMESLGCDIVSLEHFFMQNFNAGTAVEEYGPVCMERMEMILAGLKCMHTLGTRNSDIERYQNKILADNWTYGSTSRYGEYMDLIVRINVVCQNNRNKLGEWGGKIQNLTHQIFTYARSMPPRSIEQEGDPKVKKSHLKELLLHFGTAVALIYAAPNAKAETVKPDESSSVHYSDATASLQQGIPKAEYGVQWIEPEAFPQDTKEKTISLVAFDSGRNPENDHRNIFLEEEAMDMLAETMVRESIRSIRRLEDTLYRKRLSYQDDASLAKLGIGIDTHVIRLAEVDKRNTKLVRDTTKKFEMGEGIELETWNNTLFFRQDHRGFLMMNIENNLPRVLWREGVATPFLPLVVYDETSPHHYTNFRMAMLMPNGPSGHFSGTPSIPLDAKYEEDFNKALADYFQEQADYLDFLKRMKKEKYAEVKNKIQFTNNYDQACRGKKDMKNIDPTIKKYQQYISMIPPEVIGKFGAKRIVRSDYRNPKLGGEYDPNSNVICMYNGSDRDQGAIFHELFHSFDRHDQENNEIWIRRFDIDGSRYANKYVYDFKPRKGFASPYGSSNETEDQATMAEKLFSKDAHRALLMRARTDKVLREKIETITGCAIDLKNLKYASTMTVDEYKAKTGYDGYRFFLNWSPSKMNHHYWNKILAGKNPL